MLLSVQVIFCLFALSSASLSGLYVDNGIDQTVIQRILSKQEKRDIEQEILNLLGLPDRPRVKRFVKPEYLDHSGSKYLLDVYKSLLDMPSRTTRSEININEKDLNAIEESDAIVSFRSHNRQLLLLHHKMGSLMWFDISEISQEASVLNAELRIYHSGNSNYSSDLTAAVYKLSDSENGELDLVTSFNLTNDHTGWLNFNVTGVFGSWVVQPYTNEGLYISVKLPSGEEISCKDAGLEVDSVEAENQPYLVAFLRGSGEVGSRGTTRAPRVRRVARRSRKNTPYHNNPLTDWSQPQRSCQIQTLYVSFRDLNWQDWIIAPDGYGAFYCSGECNFPLNAHMNATNHAIVQTLVHLMNPIQVPKPCCAPTRLTPISVLYYLEDSNVILKKYKNMVVKSCGCH